MVDCKSTKEEHQDLDLISFHDDDDDLKMTSPPTNLVSECMLDQIEQLDMKEIRSKVAQTVSDHLLD